MVKVGVVDYGIGNVSSVIAAFDRIGVLCAALENATEAQSFSHLVLPGVGAFGPAMKRLEQLDWVSAITQYANSGGALLGICLGMQILATESCESAPIDGTRSKRSFPGQIATTTVESKQCTTSGLGLIPGVVQSLKSFGSEKRIPHMGWNSVHVEGGPALFSGLPTELDMYFVHSYGLATVSPLTIASTNYGCEFSAAIQQENVMGTQFHPEKSSQYGLQLLQNFVSLQ